jgi:hypothetical protein
MVKSSRPTQQKRRREKAQQERQKEKEERRAAARERKANTAVEPTDGDPDLAGMRPGPQPPPEWMNPSDDETEPQDE